MITNSIDIKSVRNTLLNHPIYQEINTPERLKVFMEYHVFAVWDFMSLLKRLQLTLTNLSIPWTPVENSNHARFINDIVIGEETDIAQNEGYSSHFELYIKAMNDIGANTDLILNYIEKIKNGKDPILALRHSGISNKIIDFVTYNLNLAMKGSIAEVASAFFFGREDLIPDMFDKLLTKLQENRVNTNGLDYYLKRHIELDSEEHGPLAEKLLISLCNTKLDIEASEKAAITSLENRIALWDAVLHEIKDKHL